jgi:hypothetical protein
MLKPYLALSYVIALAEAVDVGLGLVVTYIVQPATQIDAVINAAVSNRVHFVKLRILITY